jgi:hypothetical protein
LNVVRHSRHHSTGDEQPKKFIHYSTRDSDRGTPQGEVTTTIAKPGSFPVLLPRIRKLVFPTFDDKEDPLTWLNRCEQFFKGKNMPENEKVWCASYDMT